jgi:heparosan-N-sulfate-glucuronate 5-epimerase
MACSSPDSTEASFNNWLVMALTTVGVVAVLGYASRLRRQLKLFNTSLDRERVFDDDFQTKKLGRYYYSYFPSYLQPEFHPPEVDKNGIPVSDFDKLLDRGVTGLRYSPLTVSHWVLGAFDDYLRTGNEDDRDLFLRRADWLVENLHVTSADVGYWHFQVDWPAPYHVKAPFASAMAQGFGLSGLVRAYQHTGHRVYLETAQKAMKSFGVSVYDGGIMAKDEQGNVFYEEIPCLPASHILNGHIFALFGLHDYYRVTGSEQAKVFFEAGVDAVRSRLLDYDAGFWSRYSLDPNPNWRNHWNIASPIYQRVHIDQLRFLERITGEQIFGQWANRWEKQMQTPARLWLTSLVIIFKDWVVLNKKIKR